MSQKFRLTNLGLYGLLLLLLVTFSVAMGLDNFRQIEQSKAESLKLAFESHDLSADAGYSFLDELKSSFQTDWQVFLRTTVKTNIAENTGSETSILNTDLKLYASTLSEPFYEPAQVYMDALNEKANITRVKLQTENDLQYNRGYSFPIYDLSKNIIGVAQVFWDINPQAGALRNQLLISFAIFIAILLVGAMGSIRMYEKEFSPLKKIADFSNRIFQGDFHQTIPVEGEATQATIATNLNAIASRLAELSEDLDALVTERTNDLEKRNRQIKTVAEIASQIAAPHHLDDLLATTVKLIRERFDYYHIGIFLVDDQKQFAILRAANGETGRLLVQSGHKLRIGQSGIVGLVTAKGEARIAADVTQDPAHYRNPILPYTRAEMALPLKAGGEIIGAIDVQSTEIGAFSQEDVSILQTLADQLAVAIENTRLVEKLEASVEEANRLEKIQVEETWRHYTNQAQITGYQYDQIKLLPVETNLPEELKQQLNTGKVVVQNAVEPVLPNGDQKLISTMFVPLSLRNQLIGVIGIEQDDPDHIWSDHELAIVQAAANQVSLTLENARLLDETRQRAERERIAGQITARIRMSNDPNQIMQTAVSELKQALRAQKAQVLIAPRLPGTGNDQKVVENHPPSKDNGGNGHGS